MSLMHHYLIHYSSSSTMRMFHYYAVSTKMKSTKILQLLKLRLPWCPRTLVCDAVLVHQIGDYTCWSLVASKTLLALSAGFPHYWTSLNWFPVNFSSMMYLNMILSLSNAYVALVVPYVPKTMGKKSIASTAEVDCGIPCGFDTTIFWSVRMKEPGVWTKHVIFSWSICFNSQNVIQWLGNIS